MSRLADIYKSEKKKGGGLGSTLGKAALEKIDPRKMFDQSGLMATMLPSLFKSYSATSKLKDNKKDGNTDTIKLLTSEVSELKTHSKIAAKNSMYLPEIARDINFLRMQSSSSPKKAKVSRISPQKAKVSRIPRAKSVRSPDGTSSFFKTSAARNKEYNDQFKKNSTSPTQVGEKKESGGLFSGFFSGLMDGVKNIFSSIVEGLLKGGLLIGLMYGIGKYFLDKDFRESVNKAFDTFFTKVFGPEYKKYLYTGAAILLGAIVAVKLAMAGLQAAAAAAARSLFGLGGGPIVPDGPGRRNRTGRPKSKGGGRYALAAAGVMVLDSLFNTSSDDQDDVNAADVNGITQSTNQEESEPKRKLGLNADTGIAAVEGALITKSAVDSVRSIKENLTPDTPDTDKRSNSPSRVTDMSPEEKRKYEVNRKNGMNPVEAKRQAQGFKTMSNTATNIAAKVAETATKPLTKWGRFLVFVERKSGALFARLGIKLASMAGMAAIPIAGWISALFQLGFIGMDLWLIYEIWCDFSNQDVADNTPTLAQSPNPTSPTLANNKSASGDPTKTSGGAPAGMEFDAEGGLVPAPIQKSPIKVPKGAAARGGASAEAGAGITFASLTREQQDAVLKAQRDREGFYPPKNGKAGSLSHDLNNPGNILYSDFAAKYGAKPDTTGRGVGDVKGKFARFPTLERGVEAQRALWLSPAYANLPLDQAINKWTTGKIQGTGEPGIENYKKTVLAAAGGTYVPGATPAPTAVAAADGATPAEDFAKSEMGMALQLLSAIKSSSPSPVPGGGNSFLKLAAAADVKTQASANSTDSKQASNVIVNNTNNSSASQTAQAALPTVYNDDLNSLLMRQYA